jgi:hypothetical protein
MGSAADFKAKTTSGNLVTGYVGILDGARCDATGNVRTAVGEFLHSVDLIRAPAHYVLRPEEEAILLATLHALGKYETCFPEIYGDDFPGPRTFKFDMIAEVQVSNLQSLHHQVNRVLNRPVSVSIFRKTLQRAGMQLPRSQRRHARRTDLPDS